VLRVREPNLERRFTTPWVWFVAPMGAISAIALMAFLSATTWIRLIVWFVIGMIFYFGYGVRRSKLAQSPGKPQG
jgi:basic amino acid/polyamine antiporter, APA family